MKFTYFIFLIQFLINCHVPTHVPKTTQPLRDTIGFSQTGRIYDTSDLDIQVVHNPKVPRVYGIQLWGKGDCCPVQIEKVVFGDIVKVYSDTCERSQKNSYDNLDRCTCIPTEEPFFHSRFKLEIDPQKQIQPNTQCIIYYTTKTIKKMNYVDTIQEMDCFIENISGVEDHRNRNRCIWAIGADQ